MRQVGTICWNQQHFQSLLFLVQLCLILPKYLLVPFQSLNSVDDWLLSENGLIPVKRLWKPMDKSELSTQEEDKVEGPEILDKTQ